MYDGGMSTPRKVSTKPHAQPTLANIRGLYGQVEGMTRGQVIAELEAVGAIVLSKASKHADCALVGAEPVYSKALEREFLWRRDRVKSYGPKTLLALLPPAVVAAAKTRAKAKAAASK